MTMQSSETSTMLQLISGFHVSRALYVAAKLGLADLVAGGLHDGPALAAATATDASSLMRVLRLLATVGVFEVDEHERVRLTPLAETLRQDAPASLRGWAIGQLGDEHYMAWGDLLGSVRTGQDAFRRLFGKSPWEHRVEHAASAEEFDAGMSSFLRAHIEAVINAYPFGRFRRIVDVAGGDGQMLAAILATCADTSGQVFEVPHVAERAARRFGQAGLAERATALAGSIFDTVPAGADAYLLSRVIHDWADADAIAILKNCRLAANPASTLILVERVLPDRMDTTARARALAASDVNMLVMTGGRERTEAQYRELLAAASWRLTRLIATATALSLVEAAPA